MSLENDVQLALLRALKRFRNKFHKTDNERMIVFIT